MGIKPTDLGLESTQEVKEQEVGGTPVSWCGQQGGETRRRFKRGDLDFLGDNFHFGQVEFEGLIRCPRRHNQQATKHFHSSYSKFKLPLSEKTFAAPPRLISIYFSPLHVPLSQHHHLFVYLPLRLWIPKGRKLALFHLGTSMPSRVSSTWLALHKY